MFQYQKENGLNKSNKRIMQCWPFRYIMQLTMVPECLTHTISPFHIVYSTVYCHNTTPSCSVIGPPREVKPEAGWFHPGACIKDPRRLGEKCCAVSVTLFSRWMRNNIYNTTFSCHCAVCSACERLPSHPARTGLRVLFSVLTPGGNTSLEVLLFIIH